MTVRLRQVALVAPALEPWASELATKFGLREPYRDPGISEFGLENVVFEVGQSFLEVVAPVKDGTTAGRLIDKRGGAGGYMAIFQVDDLELARKRFDTLGVRIVWQADLPDIAGTHLHPKDVPGAIVSVDWASPHDSWRWAGPRWTGQAPADASGGVQAITVAVEAPVETAQRWGDVLDVEVGDGNVISLGGGQSITFVASGSTTHEGIVDVTIAATGVDAGEVTVGSVTVRSQRDLA
jgi:hypothetical protein